MVQQARNLAWKLQDGALKAKFMLAIGTGSSRSERSSTSEEKAIEVGGRSQRAEGVRRRGAAFTTGPRLPAVV